MRKKERSRILNSFPTALINSLKESTSLPREAGIDVLSVFDVEREEKKKQEMVVLYEDCTQVGSQSSGSAVEVYTTARLLSTLMSQR